MKRRWISLGVAIAALGLLGALWAWPRAHPWPARLVIAPRGDDWCWGYTPDGRSFRTVGRAGLTAYDTTTGRPDPTTPVPEPVHGRVIGRTFSADGRRFVGWNGGDASGVVVAAGDAETGAIERRLSTGLPRGQDLEFRPDGRTVDVILPVGGNRMTVITWDTTTGAESRRTVRGPGAGFTSPVAYAPDGRVWAYIARAGGGIQLWDSIGDRPIGGQLRPPTGGRDGWAFQQAPDAAFSRDGWTLMAPRSDGHVESWDIAGRFLGAARVHPDGYSARDLHLAPDGRSLVLTGVAPASRLRVVWATLCRRMTGRIPDDPTEELAVLDLATNRVVARLPRGRFVGFSPDGRTVIAEERNGAYSFRDIPGR